MANNNTSFNSGLSSGIVQDLYIDSSGLVTYKIFPQSATSSCQQIALTPTQQRVPRWIEDASYNPFSYTQQYPAGTTLCISIPPVINGVAMPTVNGNPVLPFDCLRCPQLLFGGAPTNGQMAIRGYDDLGNLVIWSSDTTATITDNTVTSTKAMMCVEYVFFGTNPNQTCTIQGSPVSFGLPYYLNNAEWVTTAAYSGGGTVVVAVGQDWRTAYAVTAPTSSYATVFEGADARGLVELESPSTAPNGLNSIFVSYYAYGNDESLNKQLGSATSFVNAIPSTSQVPFPFHANPGSSIAIARVQNGVKATAAGKTNYVLPNLVAQDVLGLQFPHDAAFGAAYWQLAQNT